MNRKAPAFQLYVDDFIGGTHWMTPEEVGVYIRLLCHQWSHGCLPGNTEQLARICGCVTHASRNASRNADALQTQCGNDALHSVLSQKFVQQPDGTYLNRRLEDVRQRAWKKGASRSAAASKAARARWDRETEVMRDASVTQCERNASEMPQHASPTPSPTPNSNLLEKDQFSAPTPEQEAAALGTTKAFESWWANWPRKHGKAAAMREYLEAVNHLRRRREPDPHGFLLARLEAFNRYRLSDGAPIWTESLSAKVYLADCRFDDEYPQHIENVEAARIRGEQLTSRLREIMPGYASRVLIDEFGPSIGDRKTPVLYDFEKLKRDNLELWQELERTGHSVLSLPHLENIDKYRADCHKLQRSCVETEG